MLEHIKLNKSVAPVLAPQTQPQFSHRQLLIAQLQQQIQREKLPAKAK